jgi:hypothetical protein
MVVFKVTSFSVRSMALMRVVRKLTVSLQRTISGPTIKLTTLVAWATNYFFCSSVTPGGSSTMGIVATVTVTVVTITMSVFDERVGKQRSVMAATAWRHYGQDFRERNYDDDENMDNKIKTSCK